MNKYSIWFPRALLTLICLVFLISEIVNDHFWMSDLEVYYKAANRFLDHITLYRHPEDRHYVFKYSPVSAIFFIPLTIFPFFIAKIAYWLLLTWMIGYGFDLAIRLSDPELPHSNHRKYNTLFLVGILVLAIHFLRELHLGQVNHLLLVGYLVMLRYYLRQNHIIASLLFAATFFIKPFTLIFLPYFFIKKQFRLIGYCLTGVLLFGLTPLMFGHSMEHFVQEYAAWFEELKIEMAWKQGLLTYGNLTVFSVIARYTPLGFLTFLPHGTLIFQLLILLALGFAYLYYFRTDSNGPATITGDFALLIITIPMLAYTSANAFGFVELAVIMVLANWKSLNKIWQITAALSLVLIGCNFSEIIGKHTSELFDRYSMITIGALMLIVMLFVLRKRSVKLH